jgi:hypothetical protein
MSPYKKGVSSTGVQFRTGLGVMSLAEVRLQEGESLENALRRFTFVRWRMVCVDNWAGHTP